MSLDRRMRAEGWPPLKQVSPDRVVITDDDREMCVICGEFPVSEANHLCRRCTRGLEDDRYERECNR